MGNKQTGEANRFGRGVPMGGTVTMIYDSGSYERTICNPGSSIRLRIRATCRPIEMQVRNADGQLVTRMIRTYDAQGHNTEETPYFAASIESEALK